MKSHAGFSLVELMVASTVALAVVAGVFAVVAPSARTFRAHADLVDSQQRARVAMRALHDDVGRAGTSGAGAEVGALSRYFPVVWPRAHSTAMGGTFPIAPDAVTVVFMPAEAPQSTLAEPLAAVPAWVRISTDPGCPAAPPPAACGLQIDDTVAVFDGSGSVDILNVSDLAGDRVLMQAPAALSKPYPQGAFVGRVIVRTFSWNRTSHQLVRRDVGRSQQVPIVDHVVSASFEYFGERRAPSLATLAPVPTATYGLSPPPVGTMQGSYWPPGENCTFGTYDDGARVVHVPRLPDLGSGGALLLHDPDRPLTALDDGPWCPEPGSTNRWDADLLRVRRISARLRFAAARLVFFGGPPTPDSGVEIATDITPPNLRVDR
jgi:hypothetical protein